MRLLQRRLRKGLFLQPERSTVGEDGPGNELSILAQIEPPKRDNE
jgi:hypothetical protein